MTAAAKQVIATFAALPDADKREVLDSLLQFVPYLDHSPLSDGDLVSAADELFQEYDRREQPE
jgi:hypothetical protein